jgi:hypothetical protein
LLETWSLKSLLSSEIPISKIESGAGDLVGRRQVCKSVVVVRPLVQSPSPKSELK